MIRLPVSGIGVRLRDPDGADDMALHEDDASPVPAALRLLSRVALRTAGEAADWSLLAPTDFECLLLHLRRRLVGPHIASHVACPSCSERVEMSFFVQDYLAAVHPATPPAVVSGANGWLALDGAAFRLPTMGDLLAVRTAKDPGGALRARCLPEAAGLSLRRRIETAVASMAPQVSGPVGGACPACGAVLQALFDVAGFVVAELRRLAAGIYAEVHLLAGTYGWAEAAILVLPGARRRQYAELIRGSERSRLLVA